MPLSEAEALGYTQAKKNKDAEDTGLIVSALAGVGSGLINIPKGVISLGAEVLDLVGDTNTAASVEKFFDDINPFDEAAEARTSGRITQALAQIGIPAFQGAKIGATLAKNAIDAKKAGNYADLTRFGKIINNVKTSPLAGGIGGAAVGEALVSDEDIGTLGDMLKGTSLEPFAFTMMNTEDKEGREDAFRRLTNRVKFAVDGSLFNLGIAGAAKGVSAIRKPTEEGLKRYADSDLGQLYQKYVKFGLGKAGMLPEEVFEAKRLGLDASEAIQFDAGQSIGRLFDEVKKVVPTIENTIFKNEEGIYKEIQDIIQPIPGRKAEKILPENLIKAIEKESGIVNTNRKSLQFENTDEGFRKLITEEGPEGFFKTNDYDIIQGGKMDRFLKEIEKTNGQPAVDKFKNLILSMRAGVDNMTGKLLQKNLQGEMSVKLEREIGNYLTADYAAFQKTFPFFRTEAGNARKEEALNYLMDRRVQREASKREVAPEVIKQDGEFMKKATQEETSLIERKLKVKSIDEIDVSMSDPQKNYTGNTKLTKLEQETLRIDASILKDKRLDKLGEILYGRITDPKHTYISTMSKMAGLNSMLEFMDDVVKLGSKKGTGKLVFGKNKFGEEEAIREVLGIPVAKKINPTTGKEMIIGLTEEQVTQGKQLLKKSGRTVEEYRAAKDLVENGDAADIEDAIVMLRDPKQFKKVEVVSTDPKLLGLSPLENTYIRAPIYDDIFETAIQFEKSGMVGNVYKYGVLAPKAIAQITKTILSPITHVRNFISAGAFAAANGAIIPTGGDFNALLPTSLGGEIFQGAGLGTGLAETARRISVGRVRGNLDAKEVGFVKRLIRSGVIDSNLQKGEIEALTKDIGITDWFANPQKAQADIYEGFLNKGKKVYQGLQDAYVGEDNYWKTITWGLERNRYENVFLKKGINASNFQDALQGKEGFESITDFLKGGVKRNFDSTKNFYNGTYDEFLDEFAANLSRNLVPNYSYIGRAGKALRLSPFGNFIAFPLEMLRTSSNILEQGIKERASGIPEIVSLGNKRLLGFGLTVGAVPKVMQESFKAIHDVSDEEMDALRRIVPPWSKNSTLLPTGRDKNGYLKYVDFSYSNAYDPLTRPFRAVFNAITDGKDEASLKASLGEGLQEATTELLKPFTDESIFTEALVDTTIRRGIGRDGRPVWSAEDDPFVKIYKGVGHLAKSFEPGSYRQIVRLGQTLTGQPDKFGQEYDLFDELPGLAGFRTQQSNPERSLTYKTTDFTRSLKKTENLFTSPLLRGGRVSSKDILDKYQYSESRRFQTLKEMAKNIDAMKKLGMSDYKIEERLKARKGLSKEVVENLMTGRYTPKEPSKFFEERITEIHNDLNNKQEISLPNPFYEALPSINEIINKNRGVDLLNEEITLSDLGTQAPEPTVSQQLTTPINITPSSMEGVNQNQGTGTEQRPAEDRIKDFDFKGVIR